ncbi:MAG TPA: MoxR family ATPase [Bacillota bacterium]|nr:MoxR family ATPase [Bacillota bacterium]
MKEYTINEITSIMQSIKGELGKAVKGQDSLIEQVIIGLFSEGHILIEGVPGLGKTLLINALCSIIIGAKFRRIQFTPDILPADIIGVATEQFKIKKGPIFTNLLLADEINRAPAKTQSALLQAMQERTVNIDGTNYPLDTFFICFATQNPVDYEGTFPLPEAQKDRFLMKLLVNYPTPEEEQKILMAYRSGFSADQIQTARLVPSTNIDEILAIKESIKKINVHDKILDYITRIVCATRNINGIRMGSSPRGSIALFQAARVKAAMNGRDHVIAQDVKDMVLPVLRHRINLEPEVLEKGLTEDDFLTRLLERVEAPV